jgi:hypothetical protein
MLALRAKREMQVHRLVSVRFTSCVPIFQRPGVAKQFLGRLNIPYVRIYSTAVWHGRNTVGQRHGLKRPSAQDSSVPPAAEHSVVYFGSCLFKHRLQR